MTTRKQISAIKYLVAAAHLRDGKDQLAKRIAWYLLDNSGRLTKDVCVCLYAGRNGFKKGDIREGAYAYGAMNSSNGPLHLGAIMHAVGSKMVFSVHYGSFQNGTFSADGQFAGTPREVVSNPGSILEGMPYRYTFWLARGYFARSATLVSVTKDELLKIDLSKPGLYPEIENQFDGEKIAS